MLCILFLAPGIVVAWLGFPMGQWPVIAGVRRPAAVGRRLVLQLTHRRGGGLGPRPMLAAWRRSMGVVRCVHEANQAGCVKLGWGDGRHLVEDRGSVHCSVRRGCMRWALCARGGLRRDDMRTSQAATRDAVGYLRRPGDQLRVSHFSVSFFFLLLRAVF